MTEQRNEKLDLFGFSHIENVNVVPEKNARSFAPKNGAQDDKMEIDSLERKVDE